MSIKTNDPQVAEAILEAERGTLACWNRGDIAGTTAFYAGDVSYFDPLTERRIDGHGAVADYLHACYEGKVRIDRYEIIEPQVIVDHDLAVLTYNLKNFVREGSTEKPGVPWNATIVYRHEAGRWLAAHVHWAVTRHPAVLQSALG